LLRWFFACDRRFLVCGESGVIRPSRALKTASEPALVRSAFDLPAAQRKEIQKALSETFSSEIRLRFEAPWPASTQTDARAILGAFAISDAPKPLHLPGALSRS
jgi:hypothetical protein